MPFVANYTKLGKFVLLKRFILKIDIFTPYNVGSVLWRLFSTLEVVQYIGGITSVLWGIASVLWRLFSTVGGCFSTVGG